MEKIRLSRGIAHVVLALACPFAGSAGLCRGEARCPQPVWSENFPDPTTWRAPDGSWRATSTTLKILRSDDFFTWKDTGRRVFSAEDERRIRGKTKHIWAPDVYRIGGNYLIYVSLVSSATNSAIAVFSSRSPDGPFAGGRLLTWSGSTGIRDTIDPEVVRDDGNGRLWLFFGSTGRMYRVRLAADGLSLAPDASYRHVAGLSWDADANPSRKGVFEGCYLYKRKGWWYLFASEGRYWDHTYAVVVGRARRLDGPFLDREGRRMTDGFATTVVSSRKGDAVFGPGHNAEIVTIGGRDYMPLHAHVEGENRQARPLFRVEIIWDDDGWPTGRWFSGACSVDRNARRTISLESRPLLSVEERQK